MIVQAFSFPAQRTDWLRNKTPMNEFQAVPENALSGIEFPAIVEDVDKAFQMLGGYNEVQRVIICKMCYISLSMRWFYSWCA